jgi:release factor glutamine methyltransferase
MNVKQALQQAQSLGLERLDAQLLVLHVLQRAAHDRAWLLAHEDAHLSDLQQAQLQPLVARRAAGEPLAYLTVEREFYGLTLRVSPDVLIPRPDTETLVDWALDVLPAAQGRVIDLGTGSGAIALALRHARPTLEVHALDLSPAALAVAQANAERLHLQVHWHEGAWLSQPQEDLRGLRFDTIVSNPPYIAPADPHLEALRYEPLSALVAGKNGLEDLQTIAAQAPAFLKPGGWLLLEHGYDQAESVRELLQARGFTQVQSRRDLAGVERCSGGRWLLP